MSQDFIAIIKERGFVHQMTDEEGLADLLKTPGQRAYIGFDCTAPSLHVGSLLQIMLLSWWQKCGHRPIVLLGGGTTKIGDPSGKDESRPPLNDAQIAENMESLRGVFERILNGDAAPIFVNNGDWLDLLSSVAFMRDYGRHFSINRMLTMDSVKLRLQREQNLSLLEFMYMVYQAYDFVELNTRYGCRVQLGGSDQWGNIIMGIELNRRAHALRSHDAKTWEVKQEIYHEKYDLFGITSPLITTSSGAKMGKTAAGAVWLNANLCPPYDYWQFWRNTEDGDVERFLKLFTELSLEEIAKLAALQGSEINEAKKVLATEATALLHGREAAEKAAQIAADTFSGAGVSDDLPEIFVDRKKLAAGTTVVEVLTLAGFATSNGEARRLIQGNGISVNDVKLTDDKHRLTETDFAQGFAKLSKGKKQHILVKIG